MGHHCSSTLSSAEPEVLVAHQVYLQSKGTQIGKLVVLIAGD